MGHTCDDFFKKPFQTCSLLEKQSKSLENGGDRKWRGWKTVNRQKCFPPAEASFCCYFIKQNSTPSVHVVLVFIPLSNRNCLTFFSRPISGFGQKLENLLPWKDRYFCDIQEKDKEARKKVVVFLIRLHHGLPYIFEKTEPTGATIGNEKGH
jgi:hypothetical protein